MRVLLMSTLIQLRTLCLPRKTRVSVTSHHNVMIIMLGEVEIFLANENKTLQIQTLISGAVNILMSISIKL